MSIEDRTFLDLKFEDIGDKVSRFMNSFKGQIVLKGYKLKKEREVKAKAGKIARRDIGAWLNVEKIMGKKYKLRIKCAAPDDDILFQIWARKDEEIPPEMIAELEKAAIKIKDKLSK